MNLKLLPKITNEMLEIIIQDIKDNKNTNKLKQREWINNPEIEEIVRDVSAYMSKTYLYPEKYNIVVSEQELETLINELQSIDLFNFYLDNIKADLDNTMKAYLAFSSFLYDTFWQIYNNNKKLIKDLRLGRK